MTTGLKNTPRPHICLPGLLLLVIWCNWHMTHSDVCISNYAIMNWELTCISVNNNYMNPHAANANFKAQLYRNPVCTTFLFLICKCIFGVIYILNVCAPRLNCTGCINMLRPAYTETCRKRTSSIIFCDWTLRRCWDIWHLDSPHNSNLLNSVWAP